MLDHYKFVDPIGGYEIGHGRRYAARCRGVSDGIDWGL